MFGKGLRIKTFTVLSIMALLTLVAMPAVASDTPADGAQDSSADVLIEIFIEAIDGVVTNSIDDCPDDPSSDPERGCALDPNG